MKNKPAQILALLFVLVSVVPAQAQERQTWRVPADFATMQEAVDSPSVLPGDRILVVGPGGFSRAYVTKRLEVRGTRGAVIDSGPAHPSGSSWASGCWPVATARPSGTSPSTWTSPS